MKSLSIKKLLSVLGFSPEEGTAGVFRKEYAQFGRYAIVVDCGKKTINYGDEIRYCSKGTQNFFLAENFVVLECVDRLLTKGYKPENIELEKSWRAGHRHSGKLDICVYREGKDRKEYLLIECKTYGAEFDRALKKMMEDGGQLFTYFKFSNTADLLMLYASQLSGNEIVYRNEIVKIENEYRSGDAADFYKKWNKLTKDSGIFEEGREPYLYENKIRSISELDDINESNSEKLFYNFLKILRANAISDKPNAFNKIFDLFMCKIYDEWHNENNGIAQFVWRDDDHPEKFIGRLTDLYEKAIDRFLNKKVLGLRSLNLGGSPKSSNEIKESFVSGSKDFAILEIIDKNDFYKNASIVKSIVQLFENLKIRYDKQNNHLSNFFEQLLTTGLKQEAGQFFTPVPVAKFILRSIPLKEKLEELLKSGELPKIIDYAAGSGHFIHESMHAIQNLLDTYDEDGKVKSRFAKEKIRTWKSEKYSWASESIYGIERDYRLSKVAKVGCYMHGDGVANIMNGNGLDDFYKSEDYIKILKLEKNDRNDNYKKFEEDNPVFDFVISNPPFSVDDFRWSLTNCKDSFAKGKHSFTLYDFITDRSTEIECLFVERTKQLLKDGGVAGIILPSSILSNAGIYAKTREMILRYFEIIAITELGSGTFMATGTNTVVLFLRRRSNYVGKNLESRVEKFFKDFQDVTMNGIEMPVAKYLNYVWGGLKWDDYLSLLKKEPNKSIKKHELYKEYEAKIKAKDHADFLNRVLATEKEKIFYFILALPQKVVIVKSGNKDAEKRFLGYEFSNRRGNEGIHPIQRGKMIDECTQMFDADTLTFDNPKKASTFIYQAFANSNTKLRVPENLKEHVFRMDLVDMMTFDWATFDKKLSLAIKKKVKIASKWDIVKIGQIASTQYGFTEKATNEGNVRYLRITDLNDDGSIKEDNEKKFIDPDEETRSLYSLNNNDVVIARSGSVGKSAIYKSVKHEDMIFASYLIRLQVAKDKILPDYLFYLTKSQMYWDQVEQHSTTLSQPNLNAEKIKEFQIPLPPLDVQTKIVREIEKIEREESNTKKQIEKLKQKIENAFDNIQTTKPTVRLEIYFHLNTAILNPITKWKDGHFTYVDIDRVGKGNGTVDWSQSIPCKDAPSRARRVAKDHTVVISTVRPYLKGFCYVEQVPERTIFSTGFALLHSKDEQQFLSRFLYYLFMYSSYLMKQMEDKMPKAAYPSINAEDMKNFLLPLLPLSEQRKIVAYIEKLESEILDLQRALTAISERKNAVLQKWL